jgi:acyl-CoA synthetase (NDP forming)
LDENMPDLSGLKKMADRFGKVAIFWLMGRRLGSDRFRQEARALGIPVHEDASIIADCLWAAARFCEHKAAAGGAHASPTISRSEPGLPPFPTNEKVWDEFDSKRFLSGCHIPVVDEKPVQDLEDAWETAQRMGLPVVLKGLLPGDPHKTERGLVHMGITDRSIMAGAFHRLQERLNGKGRILIQKQIKSDYELIAGFLRDDQFGPCVMYGLGGILAELNPDVVFAMAPLDRAGALKLMDRIRSRPLLQGFRGKRPLDKDAMAGILVSLGDLGIACPEIQQIDINPFVVSRGIPLAVDANVMLRL